MTAQTQFNLRPHTLVELFDQAFRLYRNNFVTFIGIVAIALIPVQIIGLIINLLTAQGLQTYSASSVSNPSTVYLSTVYTSLGANLLVSLLTGIFVGGIANAALTSAISSNYVGERLTIGKAYSSIRELLGRILVALILGFLIYIGLVIWTVIPCAGWFTGVGVLMFVSMAVIPMVAPVIVIEKLSSGKAIRRAWDLARGRFWWVVGYFGLLFLFNLLVINGPVQIVNLVVQRSIITTAASTQLFSSAYITVIANSITTLLMSLIYLPLQSACACLVYFDLRIRQEGLDLAMMANQTSDAPVNALELVGQSSGTVSGKLLVWKEVGYFAAISFGFLALYFILIMLIAGSSLFRGIY